MGEGPVTSPQSFTDIFEAVCPLYMAMGMTYEQFWNGEVEMAAAYRKADQIRRRRINEELWLEGIYMADALSVTVGNMFSKGAKHQYPSEPLPITEAEQQERREREQKARMERVKAAFTAKALRVNSKLGGENHDGR